MVEIPEEIDVNGKKAKLIKYAVYRNAYPTDHGLLIAKAFYTCEENGRFFIYSTSWYHTLSNPIVTLYAIVNDLKSIEQLIDKLLIDPVYYEDEYVFRKRRKVSNA